MLSNQDIAQMTMIEGRYPLSKLPVCGHCEKLGLWHFDKIFDKVVGVCQSCGAITKDPITYSTYLAKKMDVDETGDTFKRMAIVDRDRDYVNRFIYLPEFDMTGRVKDGTKTEQAKKFRQKIKSQDLQRKEHEARRRGQVCKAPG